MLIKRFYLLIFWNEYFGGELGSEALWKCYLIGEFFLLYIGLIGNPFEFTCNILSLDFVSKFELGKECNYLILGLELL